MDLSIIKIAKSLNMNTEDVIDMLDGMGITITDVNAPLNQKQIDKIKIAINNVKSVQKTDDDNPLREKAQNHLNDLVKDCIVFVDTCSLMHYNFKKFTEELNPLLIKNNKRIIVPTRVVEELKKHSLNSEQKPQAAESAKLALNILADMMNKNLIDLRGESTDNFADNVFGAVFAKHRLNHKLLLITQDGDLAEDILNLNNIKSAKGYPVSVKRINKFGYLSNFNFDINTNKNNSNSSNFTKQDLSVQDDDEIPEEEKFELKREIYKINNDKINVKSIPDVGDYVLCSNRKIKLLSCIASGGEGSVYQTDTPYVCKIYKKEKIEKSKIEKIKLMISKKINFKGICWPVEIVYNQYNEFVGYLMPRASGKELQKCLFVKPLLIKNFPNWKKRDTVELCLTILEKIQFLHQRNIILGDINPMNILVVNSKEVYFVDTDSYQIEGFPCPVGTVNYTAPEIQRKKFDTFLRSFGNEYFAVATLLFMIMLPGKPPYSQQGGESPIDNIIKMDFSYPFGEQSNKKAPDGPWRYMWSHMPYYIKEAFYTTFRKDEEYSLEKARLSTEEWYSKMAHYLKLLDGGKLEEQDQMSVELFPTRHKKNSKMVYINCKLCGKEAPEEYCEDGICRECLNIGETYRCSRCGKEMLFTNYAKHIKNAKKHDICMDCHDYLNQVHTYQYCNECGKNFEITNGEYEFLASKGFDLPKRCKECRKKSRNSFSSYGYSSSSSYSTRNSSTTSSHKSSSGGGLCFITTAACEFLNKEDDCYELTMFRNFRDSWLAHQPEGENLIKEYYEIAPNIVENINKSNIKEKIYIKIWNEYLLPCLRYIEENRFEECKELYTLMVKSLKSDFYNIGSLS